jgi:SCY1-like protein 1
VTTRVDPRNLYQYIDCYVPVCIVGVLLYLQIAVFLYTRTVLAMLNPLFYIAEKFLDKATVGKQLGSIIGILFKVNDRAIRGTLLQKAPFMSESFDRNTLNESVFEPLCSGFSDSSAALRELTLKATAALVPHLTHPNLEKLSRYLVRLQSDQEASIRTNTVIFFSKLAPYLTEMTRQKMLLPAFVRAMKDPFTPCRLAALRSTLKAKEFFDPSGLATKVLPTVTPQLLDPSSEVRLEAFAAVDDLLLLLRQESDRLSKLPEPNGDGVVAAAAPSGPAPVGRTSSAPSSTTAPSARAPNSVAAPEPPKSGGFAFGLSSWMASKTVPEDTLDRNKGVTSQVLAPSAPSVLPPQVAAPAPAPVMPAVGNVTLNDSWGEDDDKEGWDDDDELDVSTPGVQVKAPAAAPAAPQNLFAPAAEEEDFFGSFDAKPAKPVAMRKPGAGKLVMPSKKPAKPAVKKLSANNEKASDGWDDF